MRPGYHAATLAIHGGRRTSMRPGRMRPGYPTAVICLRWMYKHFNEAGAHAPRIQGSRWPTSSTISKLQ